ncbi:hypothetical protein OBBRIDRAFT_789998 [Obba rivulosa]|uniref:Uncharacterized protein n=1 Tax=Obba rivulosa TaxID=1052685 RepID=A0A8E2J352_9APHY|nr:hypothetical protein OBBRIDRAFT_789998 [Obba rivulosa]
MNLTGSFPLSCFALLTVTFFGTCAVMLALIRKLPVISPLRSCPMVDPRYIPPERERFP